MRPWSLLLLLACAPRDKADPRPIDSGSPPLVTDADADGSPAEEDCDEADPAVNPTAMEVCDEVDNNCDGQIDEGVDATWFPDADGDGFGDPALPVSACQQPAGHTTNALDCDDADPAVHPGAIDRCDDRDDDCDGQIDEDEATAWYADADGDTWGDGAAITLSCAPPASSAAVDGDCDDTRADVFPGHAERCDEADNDCDGSVDEAVTLVYYADHDADGWGRLDQTTEACAPPIGYAADAGDCDDEDNAVYPYAPEPDCTDPKDYNCDRSVAFADADADGWAACVDCNDGVSSTHPGAAEVCNAADDDCDGAFDDADPDVDLSTGTTVYADLDADGHGDAAHATRTCTIPAATALSADDCDDGDSHVYPGAAERCNGDDDDCDALIDDADPSLDPTSATTWYRDADADGYGTSATSAAACSAPAGYRANALDCDDAAAAVSPAAAEVCDGIDNDCDSSRDEGLLAAQSAVAAYAPGPSCNGNYSRYAVITACGCAPVYLVGVFYDGTDGTGGQVTGASASTNAMTLTWDDCAAGCDCDYDIQATTSWTASKTGNILSVTVTNAINGLSTSHADYAGYWITTYGTFWYPSGTNSRTFTYACAW